MGNYDISRFHQPPLPEQSLDQFLADAALMDHPRLKSPVGSENNACPPAVSLQCPLYYVVIPAAVHMHQFPVGTPFPVEHLDMLGNQWVALGEDVLYVHCRYI